VDGRRIGKVKGVPKKHQNELWEHLTRGELPAVEYESLSSLRAMLLHGTREATRVARSVTNISNSANWEVSDDGFVRPKFVDAQEE
jgi:hypothetical protein